MLTKCHNVKLDALTFFEKMYSADNEISRTVAQKACDH